MMDGVKLLVNEVVASHFQLIFIGNSIFSRCIFHQTFENESITSDFAMYGGYCLWEFLMILRFFPCLYLNHSRIYRLSSYRIQSAKNVMGWHIVYDSREC